MDVMKTRRPIHRVLRAGKGVVLALALTVLVSAVAHADPFCFDQAGEEYGISPQILRAIAKVESNFNPRAVNWNTNGTYDFGVMQINSDWYPALGKERWMSLGDPCSNVRTGAMILAGCIKRYGYSWEAVGCYNSRTPAKRDRYAWLVFRQLQRIQREDRQLKANLEAALRDRIGALVTKGGTGQGTVIEVKDVSAPTTAENPERQPVSGGPELSAATIFGGGSDGM